jgi:hypothetical protein
MFRREVERKQCSKIFLRDGVRELFEKNVIAYAHTANTSPHLTVIANFIPSMKNEISDIFVDILMACHDMGLIGGELFAIDGYKLMIDKIETRLEPRIVSGRWRGGIRS